MADVIYSKYLPNKILSFRPEPETAVYLCEKGVCLPPIKDIAELEDQLQTDK